MENAQILRSSNVGKLPITRPQGVDASMRTTTVPTDQFLDVVDTLTRTYGGEFDRSTRQFVFQAKESTVVVRFSEADCAAQFYADIGLPAPSDQLRVYRAALEHNIVQNSHSVVIGIHPQSGRIVATYALPLRQADEFDADKTMSRLLESVNMMRLRFRFFTE